MHPSTIAQLISHLKDRRRRKVLLIGDTEAHVKGLARYARKLGYRPLTKRLQSETTHEWYQWWKRWDAVKRRSPFGNWRSNSEKDS